MDAPGTEVLVRHNQAESRFEARVGGQLSVADYQLRGGEMVMTHTFVPPALRGRGIAEKLVRTALEYARQEGLRVFPVCSYVEAFLQRHSEYSDLFNPEKKA
jgi:predicted GNAT family acetyltransferase